MSVVAHDENRFASFDKRVARIEDSILALNSLTSSLAQASAIFEFKHDQSSKLASKLEDFVSRMGERDEAAYKKTIELFGDRERRLAEQLTHFREMMRLELATRDSAIDQKLAPIHETIKTLTAEKDELQEKVDKLDTRIGALEKWLWMVMGGAIVVSYIIQNLFPLFQ